MPGGGVHFRVWAPNHDQVAVIIDGARPVKLAREHNGYHAGVAVHAAAGSLYRLQLGNNVNYLPDPASRFQPEGPHGPSQVMDPEAFVWTDPDWRGVTLPGQVIYEMHIGTYTQEGTWRAAEARLESLKDLGITLLEIMPITEFPGSFGWGYDGVDLYAPTRLYGSPDDFRTFVNTAHRLGLGVILDVVYNHLGPDGNYLREFSSDYFSTAYKTEWGEAINYDDNNSQPVREFIVSNACYWISEFHVDGLRLDATQQIFDSSADHIVATITRAARRAAGSRSILVIAENEPQHARLLRAPDQGGYGLDALWNDDFHHSARVAVTGRREAYYSDYRGTMQELLSAVRWGFLYQGQYYPWQQQRRGTAALDIPAPSFVLYLENHDQTANTASNQQPGYANYRRWSVWQTLAAVCSDRYPTAAAAARRQRMRSVL